ncbi:phosphodiester glycosidase family protein [Desulfitobacterium sp. Sab5]|uniref:phosphodiester glycosidase family protein n=1 Tax=Desulfitobacterium nosdiversum TaxID=3375356 RepID=UPI003CF3FF83
MAITTKGITLSEFAKVFADLGCTEAYNLDGRGSSTMYFIGRVVNNPLSKQEERSISDILYING